MADGRNLMKAIITSLVLLYCGWANDANAGQCVGKFANPITDICWSCTFPIKIAGRDVIRMGQEDVSTVGGTSSSPGGLFCICSNPLRCGIKASFWEPARRVDVTRTPYCFVSLGGITINPGINAPEGEVRIAPDGRQNSAYQLHWYVDPIFYWLGIILDNPCMEKAEFDLAYMTELDPTWQNDELTFLLNPEVALFSNPLAQASCAGDCVLSTLGFGSGLLFWCAGCQGSIYPVNGHVAAHTSAIQASSLVMQRFMAKGHRMGLLSQTAGGDAMCGYKYMPIMDKGQYKYQMLYPISQTTKIAGRCCQPLGRTTVLWGAGRQIPYIGEDFAYLAFRKRDCCLGVKNCGLLP
jgi:conjugal transfer pilus assembly protein TraU